MGKMTLLDYVESKILFPVLQARTEEYPGRRCKLERVQRLAIGALRNAYYPLAARGDTIEMFAGSMGSALLKTLWLEMEGLGFASPLRSDVELDMLRLFYGEGEDVPEHEAGGTLQNPRRHDREAAISLAR